MTDEDISINKALQTCSIPFFLTDRAELNYQKPQEKGAFRIRNKIPKMNSKLSINYPQHNQQDYIKNRSGKILDSKNPDILKHVLIHLLTNQYQIQKNWSEKFEKKVNNNLTRQNKKDHSDRFLEYIPLNIKEYILQIDIAKFTQLNHIASLFEKKMDIRVESQSPKNIIIEQYSNDSLKLNEELFKENTVIANIIDKFQKGGLDTIKSDDISLFRTIVNKRLHFYDQIQQNPQNPQNPQNHPNNENLSRSYSLNDNNISEPEPLLKAKFNSEIELNKTQVIDNVKESNNENELRESFKVFSDNSKILQNLMQILVKNADNSSSDSTKAHQSEFEFSQLLSKLQSIKSLIPSNFTFLNSKLNENKENIVKNDIKNQLKINQFDKAINKDDNYNVTSQLTPVDSFSAIIPSQNLSNSNLNKTADLTQKSLISRNDQIKKKKNPNAITNSGNVSVSPPKNLNLKQNKSKFNRDNETLSSQYMSEEVPNLTRDDEEDDNTKFRFFDKKADGETFSNDSGFLSTKINDMVNKSVGNQTEKSKETINLSNNPHIDSEIFLDM